jgi:peptide/nickel transport system permease protein
VSVQEVAVLSPRARRRRRIRRRLMRRPLAVAGGVVALMFVLVAIFAPVIAPYDPGQSDFGAALAGPSSQHLFGTDELGRDVFSRVVWGARASMQAGVFSTLLALVIAVPIGLVAGYYRGWVDPVVSRITDVMLAFPFLILAVGLAAVLGPSLTNATIALAPCARRTSSAPRSPTARATA